jgi:asparagine synthetase B (glutamine-hydrolysing)
MSELVEAIRNAVQPQPSPCVNISGGIDSTIVLHHLNEKTEETIYTYTAGFTSQETEFTDAARVAEHYGTRHKEILIENMLDTFPRILKHFVKPRFNLWPFWLAEQASKDKRLNCYIGEGGDEHFGGYWYKPEKSYVEYWVGFFEYVYPTYKTVYDLFGIQLNVPLHPDNLSWARTIGWHDSCHEKRFLREAYRNILPDFVVDRKKQNGRKDYWMIWRQELKRYFPSLQPRSEEDIRRIWNVWVTREWLRCHQFEPVQVPSYEASG